MWKFSGCLREMVFHKNRTTGDLFWEEIRTYHLYGRQCNAYYIYSMVRYQPRPQGAFPWLWRWAKAREKHPGDKVGTIIMCTSMLWLKVMPSKANRRNNSQQCCIRLHGAKRLTSFKLCANRVGKRTQHGISNNAGSCWPTMLYPFAQGLTSIAHKMNV